MTDETPVLVDAQTYLRNRLARAADALSSALAHAKTSDQLRAALDDLSRVEAEIEDYLCRWSEWEVRTRRNRLTLVGRERREP